MKMAGTYPEGAENTVGNGEIASYKQFLLFLQCFQKTYLQTRKNQGLFGRVLTPSQKTNFRKPFPKQQILDSSELKEFADDNFKSN